MNINELDFKPNDVVKSCKFIEKGLCFQLWGLQSCCHGSTSSPCLVSTEEIKNGLCSYDLIVQRRKDLFLGINGRKEIELGGCKGCRHIHEKKFKDVHLDSAGGEYMPGAFNIQHYTECNERCLYCVYAKENDFKKSQYDIIPIMEMFRERGKLKGNNWIDFSGGEPAMLKDYEKILGYLLDNNLGTVVVYSNSSIYSPKIYEGLKKNKIILTSSLDTGIKSKYAQLRGADLYDKVFENLVKYRNSGTRGLWLKYVITEYNRTDDDLYSFLSAMLAIKPDRIMISPDFPYGDKKIPEETLKFAVKLQYMLEKYYNFKVVPGAPDCDMKVLTFYKELEKEVNKLKAEKPVTPEMRLRQFKRGHLILEDFLNKLNAKIPRLPILQKPRYIVRKFLISKGIY